MLILCCFFCVSCNLSHDNNYISPNIQSRKQIIDDKHYSDSSIYTIMERIPYAELHKAKAFCGKISAEPRMYGIEKDTGFVVEYLLIKRDREEIAFEAKAKKYFSSRNEWSDSPNLSYDDLFDFCVFDRYQTDSLIIGNSKQSLGVEKLASYSSNISYHIDSTSTFLLLYADSMDIIRSYRIGRYGGKWLSNHFKEIIIDFEEEVSVHLNKGEISYQDYKRRVACNRITMADIWAAQDSFVSRCKQTESFLPSSYGYTSGIVNKRMELSDLLPWKKYNGYYLYFSIKDSLYFVDVISRYRDWKIERISDTQEVNEIRIDVPNFKINMIPIMVGEEINRIDSSIKEVMVDGVYHYYYGPEFSLVVKEKDGFVESFRYYYGIIDVEILRKL